MGELQYIRLLLLGDFRVGKTRLLRSLMEDTNYAEYEPTFGVTYTGIELDNQSAKLMIVSNSQWEVGGYPAFVEVAKQYVDTADAVIVAFSSDGDGRSQEPWLSLVCNSRIRILVDIKPDSDQYLSQAHDSCARLFVVDPIDSGKVRQFFTEVVKIVVEDPQWRSEGEISLEELKRRTRAPCSLL